jgi:hypothetical protein
MEWSCIGLILIKGSMKMNVHGDIHTWVFFLRWAWNMWIYIGIYIGIYIYIYIYIYSYIYIYEDQLQ